jgi:ATP/ADP translocase
MIRPRSEKSKYYRKFGIFAGAVMKPFIIFTALFIGSLSIGFAQKADSSKLSKDYAVHTYFIISAGTVINAYYKDKPLSIETIADFNLYVQANVKSLKDSWVVVTGKPKIGTFDDVLKTLSHYRFKHVSKNIVD